MEHSPKVNLYRTAALETIAYVKQHLPWGASNKVPSGVVAAIEYPVTFVKNRSNERSVEAELRQIGAAARTAGHPFIRGSPRMEKQMIETWSKWGLKSGVGNCGVQSAMAFVRLRDHWKVFPLEWMQLADADHGFVIVGRDSQTSSGSPRTWNDETICCDPWHGSVQKANVYPVIHGHRIQLMYRLESAVTPTNQTPG